MNLNIRKYLFSKFICAGDIIRFRIRKSGRNTSATWKPPQAQRDYISQHFVVNLILLQGCENGDFTSISLNA